MKIARFNPVFKGFHIVSKPILIVLMIIMRSDISAITVFPFVFYHNNYVRMHFITKNRQMIFIHQQMECGMVGILVYLILGLLINTWLITLPVIFLWCIIYAVNYVANIFRYKSKLFSKFVAFNREVNAKSNIGNYIVLRRPFNWRYYLPLKTN